MFWPQSASAFAEYNSMASSSSSRSAFPRGKANSHGYWTEIIPRVGVNQVPCPRSMHAGAVWHSNLYIFGGYDGRNRSNDLHVYHFPSNSWALLSARGTAPSRRDRHTAVVYLNKLVIFGGYDGRARVNDVHILDLHSETWEMIDTTGMQEVPTHRHSHAAVVYGQSMYIFGGYDGSYCGDFHQFSFVTYTWSQVRTVGQPPSPRYRVTCVIHGDLMILHGGHDGNRHLNETHTFHFPTATWAPLISIGIPPSPRDSHVGVVIQNAMYVFGGSTGGALEDFHRLDLLSGSWSSINNSSPPPHLGAPCSRGDIVGRNGGSSMGGVMSALGFPRSDARSVSESITGPSIGSGSGNEVIVERPISSPGCRFCHIAVVHSGSMYSFGGYDGSRRLNDFLKYSFTSDLTASDIPVSTLVGDLKGFVKSDLHSDITFIVEGRKIHAHKILCMRCAFFHNMLTGEYMESREAEIEIAELTYDTFSSLIEFLYSDHCEVNKSNGMELFQAADRFGIDRLKKVCECVLATHLEVEGVSEMALAGDRYNGDILKGESVAFIISHFDAVSKTKGFEEMGRANPDLLFEILRLR